MGQRRNRQIVNRLIEELWNAGRYEVLDELCAPDLQVTLPGSRLAGTRALRQLAQRYRRAFPDLHVVVRHMIGRSDDVDVTWRATGTHVGPIAGLKPTRRRVRLDGMSHVRLRGGRVVEQEHFWDRLVLMRQIGAIPEQAAAA